MAPKAQTEDSIETYIQILLEFCGALHADWACKSEGLVTRTNMTKFAPEELASWVFDPLVPGRVAAIGGVED